MAKLNSKFKHMYDAAPSVALIAKDGVAKTASFTGPAYALDKLDGYWNDAGELADMLLTVVTNVAAVDRGAGDEAYGLTIEASADAAFTAPVEVASIAPDVLATGQLVAILDMDTVLAAVPGVSYLRVKGTLAGVAPSIELYSWIGSLKA